MREPQELDPHAERTRSGRLRARARSQGLRPPVPNVVCPKCGQPRLLMRMAKVDVGVGPSWGTSWDDVDPDERVHLFCRRRRCRFRQSISYGELMSRYEADQETGLDRIQLD